MRLALFHPGFTDLGGAEVLAVAQANYLREQGMAVEIVTLAYDAAAWSSRMNGIPVEVVPKRHWTDLFHGFSRRQKLKARARRAAPLLRRFDAVVACNFPCSTMLGVQDLEIPKVWQCNEPPRVLYLPQANPAQAARAAVEGAETESRAIHAFRISLREFQESLTRGNRYTAVRIQDLASVARLDRIYAISAFSRDNARAIYGRCEETPIYPIVNFPDQAHTRRGLDRSGLKVLVHSRLHAPKNVDTVIRGFARFCRKHPGAMLHVVGEGPEESSLKTLAAGLLPPSAIHFHGFLPMEELRTVYAACDVLALLTLDEPFGLVYPEAAARGLLLIGPDHGGPCEILDGGNLGEVCDAFRPEALEQALERIWALDDEAVETRRQRADLTCRQRYAREVVGRAQLELLRGLLA